MENQKIEESDIDTIIDYLEGNRDEPVLDDVSDADQELKSVDIPIRFVRVDIHGDVVEDGSKTKKGRILMLSDHGALIQTQNALYRGEVITFQAKYHLRSTTCSARVIQFKRSGSEYYFGSEFLGCHLLKPEVRDQVD